MLKLIIAILFSNLLYAESYKYTNELIKEDSPYLLQHSHNPVHWYAWNNKTFELAKRENKLIFLSIGYSTCHWCHVMEEESFGDIKVAQLLNQNYIAIKVDREEMPSVDKHFQDIYHIMHQRGGGWPLNLLLTPDVKPFFSATYIPKETKYGQIGLEELFPYFSELQKKDSVKLQEEAIKIEKILEQTGNTKVLKTDTFIYQKNLTDRFVQNISVNYDNENKGIGMLPKFPQASTIATLLNIYTLTDNKLALKMADEMLEAMAKGGIYDQIEGGFFRYSTDEEWMIPHFEKMLYTDAELLANYVIAYTITHKLLYKRIVKELILFTQKRFQIEDVYLSASDADSFNSITKELEEGYYFIFDYKKVENEFIAHHILNYKEVLNYLGISKDGNFNGKSNSYIESDLKIPINLSEAKKILIKFREKKQYPFKDNKILTSWNALYIKSLFKASQIEISYRKEAIKSLDSLLNKVYKDSVLYHQVLLGKNLKIEANLEDYSFLSSTLLEAYKQTFNSKYLHLAQQFTDKAIQKFYIQTVWYENLTPFRVRATLRRGAYVNALSIMVENLLKLSLLKEDNRYQIIAKTVLEKKKSELFNYPANYPKAVVDFLLYKKGYIILKNRKEELGHLKQKMKLIPNQLFFLYKVTNDDIFLACKLNSCFAYDKNIDKFIMKIK